MRHLSTRGRATTRLLALAGLIAALALSGAAKVGLAGTNGTLTPTITVLNDQSPLILGTPTPGGNIGYDLNLSNTSTNTLNHVAFTDTIGSTGTIAYLNAPSNVSCSGLGTSTLSCTSSQLTSGAQFDVIVLFSTDPHGTGVITNTFAGTYAPESQNTSNNRTDPTKQFAITTDRNYSDTLGGFFAQSLLLPTNSNGQGQLSVGGSAGQTSSVKMPPGFLNSNNYVGTTLQNLLGTPGCTTCLQYQTNVTMPLAPKFQTTSPFWTGTIAQPFQVTIKIPGGALTNGFKPSGVWHRDDTTGAVPTQLQKCTYDANNNPQPQLTTAGICIASLVQQKPSKDVIAITWALSNGSYWIG